MFVPYFRYLIAPALVALEAAGAATQPRKKRKKKEAAGFGTDTDAPAPEAQEQWHLRLQVPETTGHTSIPCFIEFYKCMIFQAFLCGA